jgi:hypothetical protein
MCTTCILNETKAKDAMFTDTLVNGGGGGEDDHHHRHGHDTSAFTAVKYMVLPYQQPQLLLQLNFWKN